MQKNLLFLPLDGQELKNPRSLIIGHMHFNNLIAYNVDSK